MFGKIKLLGMVSAGALAISTFATPAASSAAATATPIQVYGSWLCGNDECTWGTVRDMTDFDYNNHWLIDRGDGHPSVNLVVLAFVNPLKLLNQTNDAQTSNGIPVGMTSDVVNYFTSHGVRVMLSIGGITYVDDWNTALATNATQLGLDAAAVAKRLGVGIEIDYEQSSSPDVSDLQAFINAYRSQLPYDASGANPAARLTIDVAAGDRWLIALDQYATANWLTTTNPVLDYANAMVPSKQPSTSGAESNWQEHVDGKSNYSPAIPPLAPAKFTGSVYITDGHSPIPECVNFASSLENSTGNYVQTVAPNGAGTTSGMLGYMFWAAERPSSRNIATTPPNTCEGGVGVGASTYTIPVPMPALRQS
ncbi:MAG TPA: glycosyl hydrolase family 18 protein [Acidothermaceae bacterium]|nr:glycosyl hydrolase family 18 protein [Acidothermaceae bacterium]